MPSKSSPPRFRKMAAVLAATGALLLTAAGMAVAQDRTVTSAVSVRQDQVGTYTLNHILEAGRQFFAVDFLEADGHGEGPLGPRAGQKIELWKGAGLDNTFPFLRINGLDSQSCFACHNSAGTAVARGELFKTQKPGGVGGSADFASVLFSNADFPEAPLPGTGGLEAEATKFETTGRLTHIVRAPPRAFGSAYVQELALEMTEELEEIVKEATAQAQANPGTQVQVDLITKGVDFGDFTIRCDSGGKCDEVRDVMGIQADLIVRPFQHKGVAATVRGFSKSALDFHHSMQAVEVVGVNNDCDDDDFINEMAVDINAPASGTSSVSVQQSLGNVLALSAFTGMLRPPTEAPSTAQIAAGEIHFTQIGCAECHVKSLTTRVNPKFRVQLGEPADGCPDVGNCGLYGCFSQLGSFAEADAAVHPAKDAANKTLAAKAAGPLAANFCPSGFYCVELTNPGALPGDFKPRLPANANGSVTVRLFSDLKRHDLGNFLDQISPAQADDVGTPIPNEEWLTQKLWGVRDNGPWMHDGRARTIREAILFHAGEDGTDTNSDAYAAVNGFQILGGAQQNQVLEFLNSLTIPLPQ